MASRCSSTWCWLSLLALLAVSSDRRRPPPARAKYSGKRLRALCHERERTGKLTWCLEDFLWFASLQTMPDLDEHGETQRFVLEPHLLLIAWEVFVRGRVELLAMLPKGNGKTAFFAALAVFHLLTVRNASCYIGAADSEQAGEMFRFAVHYVESSPALRKHLRIGRAQKIIRARAARGEGFIKVLASDNTKVANKKQGYNPTLALIDELHAHDNDNMYVDLRSGVTKRPGRLIVIISTAGSDRATILGQLLERILRQGGDDGGELVEGLAFDGDGELVYDPVQGRLTVARAPSGRSVALVWALREKSHPLGGDNPLDFDTVKLANPASWVTRDSIEDGYESLPYARYLRWRCNLWAQADDAKIPAEAWDALETGATIPPDAPVLVVVDYARKSDSTCATQLWLNDDGKLVPEAHVWALEEKRVGRPQPAAHTLIRGERTIRQSLVREHIRCIRRRRPRRPGRRLRPAPLRPRRALRRRVPHDRVSPDRPAHGARVEVDVRGDLRQRRPRARRRRPLRARRRPRPACPRPRRRHEAQARGRLPLQQVGVREPHRRHDHARHGHRARARRRRRRPRLRVVRLMWRRKRRVRIHQNAGPSFEGIQLGRRPIGGHYVLIAATALEGTDDNQVRAVKLDAGHVEIPAGRVVFIEVTPS